MAEYDLNISEEDVLLWTPQPLSNVDDFRASALHFKDYGRYTNYPRNENPLSPYYRFWREELRRCIEGYHIGKDWIPGYFYYYLNYSRIDFVKTKEIGGIVTKVREEDFPAMYDIDRDYFLYLDECEKAGRHAVVLKARRKGYSFKGGAMLARNYHCIPGSKSYAFAASKDDLSKDGLLTKAYQTIDFVDQHTEFSKRRSIDQLMHKKSGFKRKLNGVESEYGFKSEVIGLTFKNNPEVGRGKAGKLILWEEAGRFPNLLRSWRISLSSLRQGKDVFGLSIAFGTGGSEGSDFEALEEMFYSPEAYEILPRKNIWDDNAIGTPCGFFVSDAVGLQGHLHEGTDKFGNSDVRGALDDIKEERRMLAEKSSNPANFIRAIAEHPIKPQEAILRIGNTAFPVEDLKQIRARLISHPEEVLDKILVGKLVLNHNGDKANFVPDGNLEVLNEYPIRKNMMKTDGAVCIYELPIKNPDGEIPWGRYIAGTDPYRHDQTAGDSVGATYVLDRMTDRIVAEYIGRPLTTKIHYENIRRLMMFYNAVNNHENDVKGMRDYFEQMHSSHYLYDIPNCIKDKIDSQSTMSRPKGTPGTISINSYARDLIANYLWTATSDGKFNMHTIRSIGLLEEMMKWNPNNNFDRVSALGMLMIIREDKLNIDIDITEKHNVRAMDNVWRNAYHGKKSMY